MERSSTLATIALIISMIALAVSLFYRGGTGSAPAKVPSHGKIKASVSYKNKAKMEAYQKRMALRSSKPAGAYSVAADSGESNCTIYVELYDPTTLQGYEFLKPVPCSPPVYACGVTDCELSPVSYGSYLVALIDGCDMNARYYLQKDGTTKLDDVDDAQTIEVNAQNPSPQIDINVQN